MQGDPAYAELIGKMEKLSGATRKKGLRRGLRKMGDLVAGAIRERTPEQHWKLGGLGKSHDIRLEEHLRVQVKVPDDANAGFQDDKVAIAFDRDGEPIARWVEYGHRNVRGKKGSPQTEHGSTPAYPFIRPAYDATKEPAVDLLEETFTEVIAEEMDA